MPGPIQLGRGQLRRDRRSGRARRRPAAGGRSRRTRAYASWVKSLCTGRAGPRTGTAGPAPGSSVARNSSAQSAWLRLVENFCPSSRYSSLTVAPSAFGSGTPAGRQDRRVEDGEVEGVVHAVEVPDALDLPPGGHPLGQRGRAGREHLGRPVQVAEAELGREVDPHPGQRAVALDAPVGRVGERDVRQFGRPGSAAGPTAPAPATPPAATRSPAARGSARARAPAPPSPSAPGCRRSGRSSGRPGSAPR